jgi:hypothetical protein
MAQDGHPAEPDRSVGLVCSRAPTSRREGAASRGKAPPMAPTGAEGQIPPGAAAAGLSPAEARQRLAQYGYNEIPEKKTNPFLKFLAYFGRTAQLVHEARIVSHFQRAVLKIGDCLILLAVTLLVLILAVALFRGERMLAVLQFTLVLTVAAIPVAMPIGWGWGPAVWGYALAWFPVNDRVKLLAYRVFDPTQASRLPKRTLKNKSQAERST